MPLNSSAIISPKPSSAHTGTVNCRISLSHAMICLFAGFAVVLMVEDTITIRTLWSEAVTELSLWTFMYQVCVTEIVLILLH